VTPLAEAALARAETLSEQKKFAEAETALATLAELEQKYRLTDWHKGAAASIESLRAAAARGLKEAEAEKLYAEAVQLYQQKELFDLKPLVDELKSKYAATAPVNDATRKPSYTELEKAVATLGKRLVVRQDGKGDYKTIQAAIDAAAPNSRIEIEDNGPYYERVTLNKEGLHLRGKRGRIPLITSFGKPELMNTNLVTVQGANVLLERLALVHAAPTDRVLRCVSIHTGPCRVRSLLVHIPASAEGFWSATPVEIENSILLGNLRHSPADPGFRWKSRNCLVVGGVWCPGSDPMLQFLTVTGEVRLDGPGACSDSNLSSAVSYADNCRIDTCNVFGTTPFVASARPGKGTFGANPMFRDPGNLDYRLTPGSPCIGKASDGGDIGCRYTPEIVELVKVALELRRRGVIKF
jgi:hypothetical protein